MYIFSGAALLLLSALLICTIVRYKREISLFSRELDSTLDDMLAGRNPDFEFINDTLSGKINVKLKRLYEILGQKSELSKQEKEKLNALISDISHQTKTPVANLKMYLQILSEREMDEKKRLEFIELSLAQTEKLEFLVISLAKMSRLENGAISFSFGKLPVIEVIADSLAQVMPLAERKNISIDADCSGDIVVHCDKKWTSEAIFNVLDNAVKYTPPYGNIHISACKNEFYVLIKIKDSGVGINESEQAKVFRRFYRSERTAHVDGLGIGLFLSRQIISGQGGFITVKSELNHGAEFIISIPM
ncbi:MAG: HAMP domain-containing histidine kinase [Ruminococcus sp.]|nr:HAMP domain-containing histidine kinase [Ruminococcus sp.]